MAIINLKNAIVTRLNRTEGFQVKEEYQTKAGETRATYFTIWAPMGHGVHEGDVLNISGLYSDRSTIFNDKVTGEPRAGTDRSINNPKFEKVGQAAPVAVPDDWAPVDANAPF